MNNKTQKLIAGASIVAGSFGVANAAHAETKPPTPDTPVSVLPGETPATIVGNSTSSTTEPHTTTSIEIGTPITAKNTTTSIEIGDAATVTAPTTGTDPTSNGNKTEMPATGSNEALPIAGGIAVAAGAAAIAGAGSRKREQY